ncbi:bifunctional phosphopantothenoylcysteine decarboxylase/phosphopantothenate--cysteine ligase CoaBC [Pelagibacterales bacterium SAG-MED15]|nr:bifunctional phosphopantothenoylcysteine decarboxylase/phosphopantothenate--cysteine ligase CoaBC [Pelagibacterales bacterium SAG-MED15]
MNFLDKKKILLIICGGIAAYKSLEIIRLLKKKGAFVKTILTKNAKKFVTPLSVVSLSQEKVYSDLFDYKNESEMDHISLSRWSDLLLIAPATANTISKLSYGLADDLAATVTLASNKQVFLAPAMNVRMWEHQSNKDNIKKLKSFGYKLIGPNIGDMACGEYGKGKMSEPSEILNLLEDHFKGLTNLKKKRALVTAGPTQEFLDPVRYITNRSSGKQGYEIANSLNKSGFDTTLISGPSIQIADKGINLIKVKTAEDMFRETINNLPVDVAVFSAAVGDWKMKKYSKDKIKKIDNIVINLEKNIDILNNISNHNSLRPKLVIGFAAETENIHSNAKKKLLDKNCDWIIANDVSDETIGFESNENAVSIFYKNDEKEDIKKTTKAHLANQIVDRILNHLN